MNLLHCYHLKILTYQWTINLQLKKLPFLLRPILKNLLNDLLFLLLLNFLLILYLKFQKKNLFLKNLCRNLNLSRSQNQFQKNLYKNLSKSLSQLKNLNQLLLNQNQLKNLSLSK